MNIIIRRERESDYRTVEILTRKAFWNVNVPGCDEHYLAHCLRKHADFIPELDLVAETEEGEIIANVMYTKATLTDEDGNVMPILTFGPFSVLPEYQRRGIGKALLEHSFEKVKSLGYSVIVIFGNPDNYVSRGFKSCHKYNVCLDGGIFPAAMLVKELTEGTLDGKRWYYHESLAYFCESADAEEFDRQFEPMKKEFRPSQEEFYIHSHSVIMG